LWSQRNGALLGKKRGRLAVATDEDAGTSALFQSSTATCSAPASIAGKPELAVAL